MHEKLSTKVQTNKRVTAISQSDDAQSMLVSIDGEDEPRNYATVFNSTTMGCLAQMDLSRLPLTPDQHLAIRTLSYDNSCKVAVKFSRAWWVELGVEPGKGGTSSTDLPIRTVVFPSWLDVSPENPAVLICSYTWAQDAIRIGALLRNGNDAEANGPLLTMILRNLATLFKNRITYEELKDLVVGHHAYAWQNDPNAAGAFALFGPGQFSTLYPAVTEPAANGKFYMVGECVSAHHAWVVGSMESATAAVYKYLLRNGQLKKMAELKMSPFGGAPGKIPDEMEEDTLYWQVRLSLEEEDLPL
jgi:monoamine oxidase